MFVSGRWHYRSTGNLNSVVVPTIPRMFAFFRSSTNAQECDQRFQVSYLLKYISKTESRDPMSFKGGKNIGDINVVPENTAAGSGTTTSNQKKKTSKKNETMAREISFAESLWNNRRYSYTHCTEEFVHASSLPPQSRTSVLRKFRSKPLQDDITILSLIHI